MDQLPVKRKRVQQVKIGSWNVCGLRAILRKEKLLEFLIQEQPHIFCLNETMMTYKAIKDVEKQLPPDYYKYWNCCDLKQGAHGVALFTQIQPIEVQYGLNNDKNEEGRVIIAEFDQFYLLCTYVPNSQAKLRRVDYRVNIWDQQIKSKIQDLQSSKGVIWLGDLNIVHQDHDIYDIRRKETWPCCSPQERQSFDSIMKALNLKDTYRELYPLERNWSFFNRRGAKNRENWIGWRLDYIIVSESLMQNVNQAYIRNDVLGSDHCPVMIEIDI